MKSMLRQAARTGVNWALAAIALTTSNSPVLAAPLTSVWTLEPLGPVGTIETDFGARFLEQRLLPYRLARLADEAQLANGKPIAAGTYLFVVYQADGQSAFCTIKDQSLGNVSKSMFIPALDKRPCLVDADRDGRFDASFGVFDKYGSALTPSGNLTSAKPLKQPAAYTIVDPQQFPVKRKFAYSLSGSKDPAKTRIAIEFDNGGGYVAWENYSTGSVSGEPSALNLRARIEGIAENRATIAISIDPALYLVGHSGGTFFAAPLPSFVK